MDRLSIVLTLMTGPVLVGGFVIAVLGLGYYGWPAIVIAVAAGLILTWPASYAIARWIKQEDPTWRIRSGKPPERDGSDADYPET